MITISEDALAFIEEKQSTLFIDIPHTVSGCCFEVTDCPSIRFGEPKKLSEYRKQSIQSATVYVPSCFPENGTFVSGQEFPRFQAARVKWLAFNLICALRLLDLSAAGFNFGECRD